ncbi:hypothetical protein NDU88_001271 [Pleurodeles waltl]|uniref:Uncharacterized protein n=1 Tax=Pleurodeles waltl TaxID=8319 RepID=A0AAV7KPV2_PLEWA|nr:hypothetical protein NDU88_001271 [Pleurodeles waltl]
MGRRTTIAGGVSGGLTSFILLQFLILRATFPRSSDEGLRWRYPQLKKSLWCLRAAPVPKAHSGKVACISAWNLSNCTYKGMKAQWRPDLQILECLMRPELLEDQELVKTRLEPASVMGFITADTSDVPDIQADGREESHMHFDPIDLDNQMLNQSSRTIEHMQSELQDLGGGTEAKITAQMMCNNDLLRFKRTPNQIGELVFLQNYNA